MSPIHRRRSAVPSATLLVVAALCATAAWAPSGVLAAPPPAGFDASDVITLAHDVGFLGVRLPEVVVPGETLAVEVVLSASQPLPPGTSIFVHLESVTSRCRVVAEQDVPTPNDGLIQHAITLRLPSTSECGPQRMEVRLGLYDRGSGKRFAVGDKATTDDRIHAGTFRIGTTAAGPRVLTPSAMAWQRYVSAATPWRRWGLGLLLFAALAWLGRAKLGDALPAVADPTQPPAASPLAAESASVHTWLNRIVGLLVAATALLSILVAIDFVKDDAYISFRYAHNVVIGEGLVFNAHDRLEGITNFLWTVVLVPFEALGLDLFQVTEVLGSALILGLLVVMARLSAQLGGGARPAPSATLSKYWAPLIIASSSSVGLWTTSGMEQPLAMILPAAGAWWLWRSWRRPDAADAKRDAWISGVVVGLGCLTRPDIHLTGVLLALPLIARAVKTRRLDPVLLRFAAGGLLVTVPGHLGRYLYYGALMPNTYYVKTGGGWLVWFKGLEALWEMWSFNATGALVLLAPLAFLRRQFLAEKLVLLAVSLGYMAYVVKVGRDEMHWHRLYLPALPFLAWLAALGLRAACETVAALLARVQAGVPLPRLTTVAFGVGWLLVLAMVVTNVRFTWVEMHGLNGRGDLSGNYHPDMGKFVTRHARPGALVAFQDMGSTPYHAPDLDFFDFIGLTDRVIARTRHRYGLHAFLETAAQRRQSEFDAEMRTYFYKQSPEWVILTSYIHGGAQMDRIAQTFATAPTPESLGWAVGSNRYQLGLYGEKFKESYRHVRTWPRSRGYYLSLFYRKDLWEKTPREVVFDAPPADVHGVTATFERGVQLLGADLPAEAVAKQEFYLTLWLQAGGPLEKDWWVFVHLEGETGRHPADHVPGDHMWPAQRWTAGQVIEDRSLLQLPPFLAPGTYSVWVGLYRRSTGARLKVVSGATKDRDHRIKVGEITIRAQRPFLDQLIRPTQLDVDRRHPERIPDHGRKPTDYTDRAQVP